MFSEITSKRMCGWVSTKSKKTHKLIYSTYNACGIAIFYRGFFEKMQYDE
jgi:hypothetical protein